MSQFVYHFKPKGMSSNRLFPLNRLKDIYPAAYEEHIKKYKGREHLLKEEIEPLGCLWNDVLHLSPINPQRVIDSWRAEAMLQYSGFSGGIEVYKIPIDYLEESTTACYQSYNFDFQCYNPDLDKIWQFEKSSFVEQKDVHPNQLEIWKADMKSGRRLFWYSHTQHILAQQEIDISSCELITCS